jgi:hypothetical protein
MIRQAATSAQPRYDRYRGYTNSRRPCHCNSPSAPGEERKDRAGARFQQLDIRVRCSTMAEEVTADDDADRYQATNH